MAGVSRSGAGRRSGGPGRRRLGHAVLRMPLLRRYRALVRASLAAGFGRDLRKWLVVAPVLGIASGLVATLIAEVTLRGVWPPLMALCLRHPAAMVAVPTAGFLAAGLIMQYLTPDPDVHSTEEIIRSYHEYQGRVAMRPFVPKLVAAVATVGSGGSAALEGPGVYGGGALGSWLWTKFRFTGLEPRDRRLLLISGAAAGMAAVFRAPLTGIIFALEVPFKDDLAHEALVPALLASVVSYATMAAFFGSRPIFDFAAAAGYTRRDLWWAALLGLGCGLFVAGFDVVFRRFRAFSVRARVPHWVKMTAGGALTGLCGLAFLGLYHSTLTPLGPDYEAVSRVLGAGYPAGELVMFGLLKLLATLFSLGTGGVSAMFVPLFLSGGAFGTAFGHVVAGTASAEVFAAVGMAAFIAAGYKTPLAAVVFVAEATGGHALIVPALIGAAVAYLASGDASVSGDQRVHETTRVAELAGLTVADVMRRDVVQVDPHASLEECARALGASPPHAAYPVCEAGRVVGLLPMTAVSAVPPAEWKHRRVRDVMVRNPGQVPADCDLQEALRTLMASRAHPLLLVTAAAGGLEGVLTATDILVTLGSLGAGRGSAGAQPAAAPGT